MNYLPAQQMNGLQRQSPSNTVPNTTLQQRTLPLPGQYPVQNNLSYNTIPQMAQQNNQYGIAPQIQSPNKQQNQMIQKQFSPQAQSLQYGVQTPQNFANLSQRSPQMITQQPQFRASPNGNVIQNQTMQQSVIVPQQLQNSNFTQQIERIEQPLQVVDLQQVEEPWRLKVQQLENELAQSKGQPRPVQYEPQQIFIQEENNNNETEKELSQAYAQIQQLINTIKNVQDDNLSLQEQLDERRKKTQDTEEQLRQKEKENDDLYANIEDLNTQIDEHGIQTEEKHSFLYREVNTWKQKFVELNKEFHSTQEQFMLVQAELEHQKHSSVQTSQKAVVTSSETRRQNRVT